MHEMLAVFFLSLKCCFIASITPTTYPSFYGTVSLYATDIYFALFIQ